MTVLRGACWVLVAVPAVLAAQGSTRGRITDSSGVAVPAAGVTLVPGELRARSDEQGRYASDAVGTVNRKSPRRGGARGARGAK